MQVFESALNLPQKANPRIVLLGNFDGFHRGHQALLQEALKLKKAGELVTIFTFEPHPSQILLPQGNHRRLWGALERRNFLQKFPVDELIEQRFSLDLAKLTPVEFWQNYILPLKPRALITGQDFKFGKDRKGDVAFLTAKTAEAQIHYQSLSLIENNGAKISSSTIKEAFLQGQFKEGLQSLGHEYYFFGTVEKGDHRGTGIGFPTANLKLDFNPSLKMGVYAVTSEIQGQKFFGVMNLGVTPTFKDNQNLKCEIHFFDFSQNVYGANLKIDIVDFIRPEQKFASVDALVEQIKNDVQKARKIFKA